MLIKTFSNLGLTGLYIGVEGGRGMGSGEPAHKLTASKSTLVSQGCGRR